MPIETIKWVNNSIRIIDQTKLPLKFEYIYCRDVRRLWRAIKNLEVRGAPALGVAAAYGVVLGSKSFRGTSRRQFIKRVNARCSYIGSSRPTAVNLFNGLDRMKAVIDENPGADVTGSRLFFLKKPTRFTNWIDACAV